MTDPQPAEATVTIASQSIELALTGKPDVKNKWGAGSIRPAFVTFTYLPEGIRAHLYGVWVREDGELTDAPCEQAYRIGDTDEWPDWMAELAREHKPAGQAAKAAHRLSVWHADALWDAVAIPGPRTPTFVEQHERVCAVVADIVDEMTPVPAPATDQAALREVIRRAVCEAEGFAWDSDMLEPDEYGDHADAVLARLPASVDPAAACICGHTEAQHFEDACLVCDCGDYLVPEAAREVIARWRTAALQARADWATVLREVGWTECSPEWLAAHPGECGTAPRVPGGPDVSHWHPQAAVLRRMADETQQPEAQAALTVQHAPGIAILCPDCRAKGHSVCMDGEGAAVTVHAVPLPGSNGISACCGRPPCEFVGERVTRDPDKVTCTPPAGGAQQRYADIMLGELDAPQPAPGPAATQATDEQQ